MSKCLIVYGTKEGHTAKIANKIGDIIQQRGNQVDVYDARKVPNTFRLQDYSAVLIGSSIHMGKWSSPVLKFVQRYRENLNSTPSAFFSVSMTSASTTPEERAKLDPYVEKFFNKGGWHPKMVGNFAGALAYTKYGFFTKWIMQWISKAHGESTDTSRDIEFTDWEQVSRFARDFVEGVEAESGTAGTLVDST